MKAILTLHERLPYRPEAKTKLPCSHVVCVLEDTYPEFLCRRAESVVQILTPEREDFALELHVFENDGAIAGSWVKAFGEYTQVLAGEWQAKTGAPSELARLYYALKNIGGVEREEREPLKDITGIDV